MILKTLTASLTLLLVLPVTPIVMGLILLFSNPAVARNDYLQGGFQQCNKGNFSIDSSYNIRDSANSTRYPGNISNNYDGYGDGSDKRIGVRWTWYLGSNCTDYTQQLITENMELAQQLELMKVCKRYAGKKLPPQFYTLSTKCKGLEDLGYGGMNRPTTSKSAYDELLDKVRLAPVKVPKIDRIEDVIHENKKHLIELEPVLVVPSLP